MPQNNIDDVRRLQFEMAEGTRSARYNKEPGVRAYLADKEKKRKEYTREGQEGPDVRQWRKSYYRGDQRMPPGDPAVYAPGDQQLKDLYEGSGKYYGYGASALGGSNGSYANQGPISKLLGVRNDKPK